MATSAEFLSPCCKCISIYADIYEGGGQRKPLCARCRKMFDEKDGIPFSFPTFTIASTASIGGPIGEKI